MAEGLELGAGPTMAQATTDDTRKRELEELVERVRAQLTAPDARLPPERLLAASMNVKRHRLRSALEILRERGEIDPGAAARGRPLRAARTFEDMVHGTNPLEVIELRLILEPALARLAAVRATPLEIRRIERAATTAPDAAYGAANLAFHRAVAVCSRNALAGAFYELLRRVGGDERVRLGQQRRPPCPNRLRERDLEHQAIAAAIAGRDPDAAARAMVTHLEAVQRQVARRMIPDQTAA